MWLYAFTFEYAVYMWNHVSNGDYDVKNRVAPVELYTGKKLESSVLRNEHTRGWPGYVLDLKLQDGRKLPKWNFRTQ